MMWDTLLKELGIWTVNLVPAPWGAMPIVKGKLERNTADHPWDRTLADKLGLDSQ